MDVTAGFEDRLIVDAPSSWTNYSVQLVDPVGILSFGSSSVDYRKNGTVRCIVPPEMSLHALRLAGIGCSIRSTVSEDSFTYTIFWVLGEIRDEWVADPDDPEREILVTAAYGVLAEH